MLLIFSSAVMPAAQLICAPVLLELHQTKLASKTPAGSSRRGLEYMCTGTAGHWAALPEREEEKEREGGRERVRE